MKKVIQPYNVARPPAPYSHGIHVGARSILFLAGQVGRDPDGRTVSGGMVEQARQALEHIRAIVEDAAYQLSDVVKTTIYVTDMRYRSELMSLYSQYFQGNPPTSTLVEVNHLAAPDLTVEIEAIAVKA